MSKYGLITKIKAVPDKRDELAAHLLKAAKIVTNVRSCELYYVSVAPTEADTTTVSEVWSSKELHDASLVISNVKALMGENRLLIDNFGDTDVTTPLGGKGLSE